MDWILQPLYNQIEVKNVFESMQASLERRAHVLLEVNIERKALSVNGPALVHTYIFIYVDITTNHVFTTSAPVREKEQRASHVKGGRAPEAYADGAAGKGFESAAPYVRFTGRGTGRGDASGGNARRHRHALRKSRAFAVRSKAVPNPGNQVHFAHGDDRLLVSIDKDNQFEKRHQLFGNFEEALYVPDRKNER